MSFISILAGLRSGLWGLTKWFGCSIWKRADEIWIERSNLLTCRSRPLRRNFKIFYRFFGCWPIKWRQENKTLSWRSDFKRLETHRTDTNNFNFWVYFSRHLNFSVGLTMTSSTPASIVLSTGYSGWLGAPARNQRLAARYRECFYNKFHLTHTYLRLLTFNLRTLKNQIHVNLIPHVAMPIIVS